MFLNSPNLVSGYYGTIVRRFSGQIFSDEHKYSPYYVSGLAYYRIEQFFRSGDLKSELKKARFHLMYLARLLAIGEHLAPFNSNRLDKSCEQFKHSLINEVKALKIFTTAQEIFEKSGIDQDKKQYKSESETELLLNAYRTHNNSMQLTAEAAAD
jgi:hypothetical protein